LAKNEEVIHENRSLKMVYCGRCGDGFNAKNTESNLCETCRAFPESELKKEIDIEKLIQRETGKLCHGAGCND